MCKYVALVLLVVLVALMVAAAVVVQQYGWPGFLVLLGVLILFGYIARKATPRLFLHLLTRPLRRMGAALRGARLTVHAVTPCDPPADDEEDWSDAPEAVEGGAEDEEPDEDGDEEPAGPFTWYQIEFTVTPPGESSSEGRIVVRPSWSPAFIGAVGRASPLARTRPFGGWPAGGFSPDVEAAGAEVWTEAGWDEAVNQVYGEQRLRLRVGVTRAVRAVTIVYAQFTELGVVPLPVVDVTPGAGE